MADPLFWVILGPLWRSRIAAIAGDCKSPVFGLRRFESSLLHLVPDANRRGAVKRKTETGNTGPGLSWPTRWLRKHRTLDASGLGKRVHQGTAKLGVMPQFLG